MLSEEKHRVLKSLCGLEDRPGEDATRLGVETDPSMLEGWLDFAKNAHAALLAHCTARKREAKRSAHGFRASDAMFQKNACGSGSADREGNDGSSEADSNVMTGQQRWDYMCKLLESFVWERTEIQEDFHGMMMESALPCLFQREWESSAQNILRRFSVEEYSHMMIAVCPRRFGKTVSTGMFAAAALMTIPDCNILCCSPVQKTSSALMHKIVRFLRELPGFRSIKVTKSNDKCLQISVNDNVRQVYALPMRIEVCDVVSSPSIP